jgi:hypothetical protein
VIESTSLNPVNELSRLALGGDEIKPAAGTHLVVRQANHPATQDIAAAEIVEEPAVESEFAKRGLDASQIEHWHYFPSVIASRAN